MLSAKCGLAGYHPQNPTGQRWASPTESRALSGRVLGPLWVHGGDEAGECREGAPPRPFVPSYYSSPASLLRCRPREGEERGRIILLGVSVCVWVCVRACVRVCSHCFHVHAYVPVCKYQLLRKYRLNG